ncbi:MAG TPA: GNAT family N-acetyltransferase [Chloroflexi bacterium]|nr:GNAT family N-acetyltransferase [Chloroflexota bacterium]
MTAAIAASTQMSGRGLRPYDPRRDMFALASLIEIGFPGRLEEAGERLIRGMRFFGRAGWLGAVLGRWVLPPAAFPYGYVWEQNGQVVGNASVLPVRGFPERWVMANVAVRPEYRGRGIARDLVRACLELTRRRGGRKVILQVDFGNEAALALYRSQGFQMLSERRTWRADARRLELQVASSEKARPRLPQEWRQQWALARRLYPEGVIWPYPTSAALFRPLHLERLGRLEEPRNWIWVDDERILGSLTHRCGPTPGTLRLILVVEPAVRGRAESDLLAVALGGARTRAREYVLDYPLGQVEDLLRRMGWRPQRDLIWMGIDL